ncbi:MAG: type II toxin-antitoxin system HicB family antitoxin [Nanoarchaeota archaeon]
MPKEYNVVIETDEDGWFVSEVLELPGCHTQGKTIDQLIKRTKEAIKAYTNEKTPPMQRFVRVQKVEV